MEHFRSLAEKRAAASKAQATVAKFDTEDEVLQHLLDTKPAILCCGKESSNVNNKKGIEDNLSAYIERFVRKGLLERSERLDYLQKTLRSKCGDETQKFYALMGFLLAMEDDATNVENNVQVASKEYSDVPDEKADAEMAKKMEEESELRRQILEEINAEREDVVYDSDSELSNWETSDEEEATEEPEKPPQEFKRPDVSLVSLRDTTRSRTSLTVKVATDSEWSTRVQSATDFMKDKFPSRVETLSQQPVISSYVDLHLKFGLFWEWKKRESTSRRPEIIAESRVIREIVCHFMSPFQENSVIFSNCSELENSKLQSFVVPTLSSATLNAFFRKYSRIPDAVNKLKSFIKIVHENSLRPEEESYPKIIKAFAYGMSELLRYVSVCVGEIIDSVGDGGQGGVKSNGTTTILQMDRKLRKAYALVLTLEHLFQECFGSLESALDFDMKDAWIVSEKLMAVLEVALRVETRLENFIVTLFILSQCLQAYLEDFIVVLEKDDWPTVSIFSRKASVRLSDANFWKSSVTLKAQDESGSSVRLSFLKKITPRMLMFLKTLEMLRQLNEDVSVVVGNLPTAKEIVTAFLTSYLPNFQNDSHQELTLHSNSNSNFAEYRRYFNYMKVTDRRVFGAFQAILNEQKKRAAVVTRKPDIVGEPLGPFLRIKAIPSVDSAFILPTIVDTFLGPVLSRGENSLKALLKEYKVQESMRLFQDIILGGREDFAQAIVELAGRETVSKRFNYEDPGSRNVEFQNLLSHFYDEGRENFEMKLRLDSTSDLKFGLEVEPKFPLNLILTPEAISKYLFISQQLLRMRKSVWNLNNLHMKDCRPGPGVDLKRALMLRFSLIHFCSSIRSFFMFKIFSANGAASWEIDEDRSFEEILQAHEDYLTRIETRLLKSRLMGGLILKKVVAMSDILQRCWTKELPLPVLLRLEEYLKHCWGAIQDYCKMFVGQEFSELEYFTGPVPSFL